MNGRIDPIYKIRDQENRRSHVLRGFCFDKEHVCPDRSGQRKRVGRSAGRPWVSGKKGNDMGEITPSENEWLIMEVLWAHEEAMTAAEIIERLTGKTDVSQKTIRVMINRLLAKGMLTYTVDTRDARIYHYQAARSKDECLRLKSRRFVSNYFGGNASLAVASFLQSADISREQLEDLSSLVESMKDRT